ncbi:MAG: hypothetical protein QM731_14535 [Chitinophagaceae bacterium]
MRKKHLPAIGIAILLTSLFVWVACQKHGSTLSVTKLDETGDIGTPADTASPNPIYNITDSCGVTCELGSCARKATFDARYCKLECKCGGFLGLYPQCSLNCKFPPTTPTNPTPTTPTPDTTQPQPSYTISYTIQANEQQLRAQADLIARIRSSRMKNADKIVSELQEIYNLFKNNNGKVTGANTEKYLYHISRSEALESDK